MIEFENGDVLLMINGKTYLVQEPENLVSKEVLEKEANRDNNEE
jgi:uncharacterized protein YlzI (FlbEa/FlbD family)